ncbi:MAG: hypothetical protein FD119_3976, partial [Stygiobacter sp.]
SRHKLTHAFPLIVPKNFPVQPIILAEQRTVVTASLGVSL